MSRKRYPLRLARDTHGIRAQDLRTLARTAWWAKRWIAALEAMRLGARFGRGRQYAVSGQVTNLVMDGPHVDATVVGSRTEPYRITLDFTSAAGDARDRIATALSVEPMMLARLLTDDLPLEVDALFRAEGIPLFPQAAPLGISSEGRPVYDVKMHCSCPDWARPCKHLVAVLLLLGEEVARRPAALLSLRGVECEDLVNGEDLRQRTTEDEMVHLAPLQFVTPSSRLLILKRLGPIPYWRGTTRCIDALTRIYNRCQPVAAEAAEGKSIDLRG